MLKKLSFVLLFISSICSGQQIRSIYFQGLEKTKPAYIRQFMTFQEGDQLDSALLVDNKQRLANLEMFSNVEVDVEVKNGYADVYLNFNELYTLLPIFSFGGIEENFWVQVGASEANLGGRGNKLTTYYQYYDRSSLALHLTFDRIKQSNWGANVNVIKWSTLEPLFFGEHTLEYEYDNYTFGVNAIRHFNYQDRVEFGGAFFTEDYRRTTTEEVAGAPNQVSKNKILGKAIFIWNRVNYHFYYLHGWHNQLNIETVQSLDNDPEFYIVFNDFKKYIRFGSIGNFAARLRLGLSSNQESPFAPFVLDSYLNIRGVGNRVDRGTGAIILNLEHRHTLFDRGNIGVQGVLFSDSGSWRNPGGDFSDFSDPDNFVLFAGGGFRFIHKKIFNAVLRVDYGFNLQEPSFNGFVLGLGQYF